MAIDISNSKIQVFQGINDNPIEPTSNKAGNGSHLIDQYNQLIDDLQDNLNTLSDRAEGKWIVISYDYLVSPGEKVLIYDNNGTPITIYLPASPTPGTVLSFIHTNVSTPVTIALQFEEPFDYKGQYIQSLTLNAEYKLASLLFCNNSVGWIPLEDNIFAVNYRQVNS